MITQPLSLKQSKAVKAVRWCVVELTVLVTCSVLVGSHVHGETAILVNDKVNDTSIYKESGNTSNGSGNNLFIGKTLARVGGRIRRTLIKFDLSEIPQNAVVSSVSLKLRNNLDSLFGCITSDISIHRLTADWEEAGSLGGGSGGGAAQTNDATWTQNLFGSQTWANPGGDFILQESDTQTLTCITPQIVTWSSNQMVNDVQNWVNGTDSNFGWIFIGNEGIDGFGSARKFNSHELMISSPELQIDYTVPMCSITSVIPGTPTCDFSDHIPIVLRFSKFECR